MARNRQLQWSVSYEPGALEAVAFTKGKTSKAKVETTGEAVQIVLTRDRQAIKADGQDATVINVTVTDAAGGPVPDADNLIRFSVTGNASIIGVGNGTRAAMSRISVLPMPGSAVCSTANAR